METGGIQRPWRGEGAMTAAVVEVVVVLVVTNSGVVVRTSDYLFDTCCLIFEAWTMSFTPLQFRAVEMSTWLYAVIQMHE